MTATSSADTRRLLLLRKLLAIVNMTFTNNVSELYHRAIAKESLTDPMSLKKMQNLKPVLKTEFHSDNLTCLHSNSMMKQKHPGVNMFRQILKKFGLYLKPNTVHLGYDPKNGKKIKLHNYTIVPM